MALGPFDSLFLVPFLVLPVRLCTVIEPPPLAGLDLLPFVHEHRLIVSLCICANPVCYNRFGLTVWPYRCCTVVCFPDFTVFP